MLLDKSQITIPPGKAVSLELQKGKRVRIINSQGGQVVDTWAFNRNQQQEHLSMEHSRSALYSLWFQVGNTLVSNLFKPMLSITEDTSPGMHDTLHAACSEGSYRFYTGTEGHQNCQDNLKNRLVSHGIRQASIPCPWNLFEHAMVDENMWLKDLPASAKPGDYIELLAEDDLILICSACPSTIGAINGDIPKGAVVQRIV